MFFLRCIQLLWLIPCSWVAAFVARKKALDVRYARIHRWSNHLLRAFHVQLKVIQQGNLPKNVPLLFVGNHQSEFDMLVQMAALSHPFSYISKMENKRMPFVGSWCKTLDVLFFDRNDRTSGIHMLREASRRLKSGKSMLIYPEGTRSKGGPMHPMHAGSLQPAFMSKAYVVPVILINSYDYYHVFRHKGTFVIHILEPIPYEKYKGLKAEGLAQHLQEQMQAILDTSKVAV